MRLIDADELKKCYEGKASNKADYLSIRKMIDNMPTAYDIDKVVEELFDDDFVRYDDEFVIPRDRAIEIVKQGIE